MSRSATAGDLTASVTTKLSDEVATFGAAVEVGATKSVTAPLDRLRMRQVFANLLDNAIKYTPEGGSVSIAIRDNSAHAEAIFRDSGIGIPAEEQGKIWARLYRGDKSRSQRGLGLGLSLVKAVVEAHGGKVTVSSEVNKGSEFTVSLPKQQAPSAMQGARPFHATPETVS